ncbi:hypothetical protein TrCOL_g13848 [Triparma columacea]|uniref:Uncharacterized protein n=1 Tax=Triparma columacea TaxID=722753 RepID=A0A9W7L6Y7_9STRA|nr:hypothetical protein TrCOL_g13848 [Triparma columacea]
MASFDEASILVAATELMESKARDFRKRADRIRKEERRKETAPEATAKSAPEGGEGGGEGGAPVAVPEWGVSEAVGMEGVVTAPAVTAPVVPATAPFTSTESEAQAATTLNGEMCTASSNGGGEVGKYDMMLMMMMTDDYEGKFMV